MCGSKRRAPIGDYGVVAVPLVVTAGWPAGSVVVESCSGVRTGAFPPAAAGADTDGVAVLDAALPASVLPSRKPRMAPSSRPMTPTRAAMAYMLVCSAGALAALGVGAALDEALGEGF